MGAALKELLKVIVFIKSVCITIKMYLVTNFLFMDANSLKDLYFFIDK